MFFYVEEQRVHGYPFNRCYFFRIQVAFARKTADEYVIQLVFYQSVIKLSAVYKVKIGMKIRDDFWHNAQLFKYPTVGRLYHALPFSRMAAAGIGPKEWAVVFIRSTLL